MNKKSFIFGILIVIIFSSIGFWILQQTGTPSSKSEPEGIEEWKKTLISLNSSIAHHSLDHTLSNDTPALSMYISKIKEKIHGFDYLIFVNKEGKILAHSDSSQIMQEYDPSGLEPLGEKNGLIQMVDKGGITVYDVASPIKLENTKLGEVHLGLKNPWTNETEEKKGNYSNLPKILIIVAAFIGIVLSLFGALGSSPAIKPVTKGISQEKFANLKATKDEIEKQLKTVKKRYEDLSKKKPAGEDKKLSEQIETLRKRETELTKTIDEKDAEIAKLEKAKEAGSTSSPELAKMKNELETKDKQINDLETQLEEIQTAQKTEAEGKETVTPEEIEGLKKEELELTQRIVKKRREEITLSQRVETKRKEELALERKIEALQKKVKESGS